MGIIYIALDQSSNITGYSIWKDENLMEFGKVKFEGEFLYRIVQLKAWMISKIQEHKTDTIEVILEEIQDQSNPQTFKKLAMVQGVLLVTLEELTLKYHLIYSSQWKSKIGIKDGKRKEQKKAAQLYVLERYGKSVTQDEADAICIGEYITKSIQNWGP